MMCLGVCLGMCLASLGICIECIGVMRHIRRHSEDSNGHEHGRRRVCLERLRQLEPLLRDLRDSGGLQEQSNPVPQLFDLKRRCGTSIGLTIFQESFLCGLKRKQEASYNRLREEFPAQLYRRCTAVKGNQQESQGQRSRTRII